MSPRTARRLTTLVLGLTLVSGLAVPAWAQPAPPVDLPADVAADEPNVEPGVEPAPEDRAPISLRLSPAILEVPHEVGRSHHSLRVDNTGSQPLQVVTDALEFTVTPDGTTQFTGPDELGAASWVDIDTASFELAPGERRDVAVTVDVPEDAEPGERYVSILFAVPAGDGEGNISITHRVAAKLYVAVPGEQVHDLALGELSAPWLVDSGTATFRLEVHNRGNVHRRFETPNQLMATSGDAEFAFENFTVLGGATRVVEGTWNQPPIVCWCTVEVETDDGQGNVITASTRVVIFPLRATLGGAALVAGLAMLLAARRRRQAARLEQQLAQARAEGARSAAPAVQHGDAATRPSAPTEASPAHDTARPHDR